MRDVRDAPITDLTTGGTILVFALTAGACGYAPLPNFLGIDASDDSSVDEVQQFLSCQSLPSTCGSAYENCCQTELVQGTDSGSIFYRSYDVANDMMFVDASHPAHISTFMLDRYEVTVGRFRAFIGAGMGTQRNPPMPRSGIHPNLEDSGWDNAWNQILTIDTETFRQSVSCNQGTWTSSPGVNENLPMTCVSWYEAMAFCIWDGGYLPTEAEWNYAASGGSEQRAYPWSNPANAIDNGCPYANNSGCGLKAMSVGSKSPKGDSKWHNSDLSGNVYEWILDWYILYQSSTCSDCAYLTMPSGVFPERVARGGNFDSIIAEVRAAARHSANPDHRYTGIGLRCARRAL